MLHKVRAVTESLRSASFQRRVLGWLIACFGERISFDITERNYRFLEEALELVQALGLKREEAHWLVSYVYNRPAGDSRQEVGGALVTLCALCIANGYDLEELGEEEVARIWTKLDKIREKQAGKPRHSPLPAGSELKYNLQPLEAALRNWRGIYEITQPSNVREESHKDLAKAIDGYFGG